MPTILYHLTPTLTRPAEEIREAKTGGLLLSVSLLDGDPTPASCIVTERYPATGAPATVVLVATLGEGAGQYSVEGGGPGGPP